MFTNILTLSVLCSLAKAEMLRPSKESNSSRVLQNGGVLCPASTGSQYFGYSQVSKDNKYFYAVKEADNNPTTAPTFFYFVGGPGASSLTATLEMNGPCFIQQDDKTLAVNRYSWTNYANGVWVESPGPTGFSEGKLEGTLGAYIDNIVALLSDVLRKYPHLNREVHLVGNSADASTVALVASKIVSLKAAIDLKGIFITAGVVGPAYMYQGCLQMAKKLRLLSQPKLQKLKKDIKKCRKKISKCRPHSRGGEPDRASCAAAQVFCDSAALSPVADAGKSVYDVRTAPGQEPRYYKARPGNADSFFNTRDVQTQLGVSKVWSPFNRDEAVLFSKYGSYDTTFAVNQVLDAGLKVMVAAGDVDYITNSIGALNWMLTLKGKKSYGKKLKAVSPKTVSFPGEGLLGNMRALTYSTGARIAFLEVTGGSHDMTLNKPLGMQQIFQAYLSGKLW